MRILMQRWQTLRVGFYLLDNANRTSVTEQLSYISLFNVVRFRALRRTSIQVVFLMPSWRNWYTRQTQNLLPAMGCGFESHRRHQFHMAGSSIGQDARFSTCKDGFDSHTRYSACVAIYLRVRVRSMALVGKNSEICRGGENGKRASPIISQGTKLKTTLQFCWK